MLSILSATAKMWMESRGLDENIMEYIMLSLKAKQDWVPYKNSLIDEGLDHHINYDTIKYKISIFSITDILGYYLNMQF